MDQRGKTPDRQKKKTPGGMDVCVVLLYKDSSMEHKWHEGQKDSEVQKMDQRKGNFIKKIPPGAWMSVSRECCVLSGLCDGLVPRPEESYRLWCVSKCV
jgi:hypothetical protein